MQIITINFLFEQEFGFCPIRQLLVHLCEMFVSRVSDSIAIDSCMIWRRLPGEWCSVFVMQVE